MWARSPAGEAPTTRRRSRGGIPASRACRWFLDDQNYSPRRKREKRTDRYWGAASSPARTRTIERQVWCSRIPLGHGVARAGRRRRRLEDDISIQLVVGYSA